MSIGRGGPKRPWKKRGGLPIRPVRWVSGASETNLDADFCTVKQTPVFCDVNEGLCALEIVQGKSDMLYADRQESTVTRVVGQISWLYSQIYDEAAPGWQIPIVRAALVTVESDINEGTWVPPDLWNRADLQDVAFMWLRQGCFAVNTVNTYPLNLAPEGNSVIESRMDWDVDCSINRKIGRDGSLFLVFSTHYTGPRSLGLNAPLVAIVQNLRVLMKT